MDNNDNNINDNNAGAMTIVFQTFMVQQTKKINTKFKAKDKQTARQIGQNKYPDHSFWSPD